MKHGFSRFSGKAMILSLAMCALAWTASYAGTPAAQPKAGHKGIVDAPAVSPDGKVREAKPPVTTSTSRPATTKPVNKGLRVFSCGHSFLPGIPNGLRIAATAGGIEGHEEVGQSLMGGSKALRHWNIPDNENKAKKALSEGKVDVLMLMPVYLPDPGIENFTRYGLEFNPAIRVLVQEFWLPYDYYATPQDRNSAGVPLPKKVDHDAFTAESLRKAHEPYFKEMDEHIRLLNEKLGKQVVFVVPVGQAVLRLREKVIAGKALGLKTQRELFMDDLGHPELVIKWLQIYCHYAVMYRRSPTELPVPPPLKDKERLARLLQEIAWEAATQHPLSGLKAPEP